MSSDYYGLGKDKCNNNVSERFITKIRKTEAPVKAKVRLLEI